jgi:hemerythrin superfamily protein
MISRMDSIISTGFGQMKAVKARLTGLVGVFATLSKQHGHVASLMKRLRHDVTKRDDLWPEIRRELLSHERAELAELYPVLRAIPETLPLAESHDREASEMEAMVKKLDATEDPTIFMAGFGDLCDAVLRHAYEEEEHIFPKAQKAIGHDRARELDDAFQATQKKLERLA